MGITADIDLFQSSQHEQALREFLLATIVTSADGPAFSKLGLLGAPRALFQVAEALATLVPRSADYLCGLAPSGIPLATAVSLITGKPLVLYNPQGWERFGSGIHVLPEPRKYTNVALIDAHLRTGDTSSWCKEYLERRHISTVSVICVPVAYDMCLRRGKYPLRIRSLANTETAAKAIVDLVGIRLDDILLMIQDLESHFWSYPPSGEGNIDEFRARNPSGKWVDYARGASGIYRPYPDILVLEKTRTLLASLPHVGAGDLERGAWDLLDRPAVTTQVCEMVGEVRELAQYHYLLGIGHLGLYLAVALAYVHRGTFEGGIVSWLGEYGFLPRMPDLDVAEILPVTMRVQFGTYVLDALRELRASNARVAEILVGMRDFNPDNVWEHLRQLSLTRMRQRGIKLICLY